VCQIRAKEAEKVIEEPEPALKPQETPPDDTDVEEKSTGGVPVVTSRNKAEELYKQVLSLKAEIEVRWFELGKILKEIKEGRHYIGLGCATWKDFCEMKLGLLELRWRAVDYLITTVLKCEEVGIEKEVAGQIGWSKLKEIAPVVTKKNRDHWIDVARRKETTVHVLWGKVQVALGKKTAEEVNAKAQYVKVTLILHLDQKKIWDLGMDVGHKVTGSDSDGHVVTGAMIPDFLATYAPGMEIPSKPEVVLKTLASVEAAFKVKFVGEVIDGETGEILVG
jgi:hypothetical protein